MKKLKYEIERAEPGVLTYRESGTEYRFPIYEEDGEVVFVAWPTSQRICLFVLFPGWKRVPLQFPQADRERITARVLEYLKCDGDRVRVITRTEEDERGFQFHPELFACKSRACEVLDEAGFTWFSDYSSIDPLHEEFGLEVCGIKKESSVQPIAQAMRAAFPQWHHSHVCFKDFGREPGWKLLFHMFPRGCGGGRCVDAE